MLFRQNSQGSYTKIDSIPFIQIRIQSLKNTCNILNQNFYIKVSQI